MEWERRNGCLDLPGKGKKRKGWEDREDNRKGKEGRKRGENKVRREKGR